MFGCVHRTHLHLSALCLRCNQVAHSSNTGVVRANVAYHKSVELQKKKKLGGIGDPESQLRSLSNEGLGNCPSSFAFIFRLPLCTFSPSHRSELISRRAGRLYFFCFGGWCRLEIYLAR